MIRKLILSVCFTFLCLFLQTNSVEAHYCDDYYSDQKERENCWWRYWNNQPSPQDLSFQQQTSSSQGSGQSESAQDTPSHNVGGGGGAYCNNYYSDQKERENCWWRYWNNQPSPQDLSFQQQTSSSQGSGQSESPWRPLTIVERPSGDGVLTVSVGTDNDSNPYITFDETTHTTHQEDYNQRTDWKPDLNEATEEAEVVVIDYPTNPSDPEDAENYWQAEEEVASKGKPYMVCFPAETVVVHVDKDGNETTRDYPEECIMVTPK